MSKHQIIYTSCKRGINGVNDGQQIYSYNASFSEYSSDSVKSLFTYKTPSGKVMTDEMAKTMPQSFTYRRMPDNSCAIVLNTYLGRDYMEGGRFGNHLSHAVICDESDMNSYPCEYYGSETLRSRMDDDEVRSSERPPFLPEPDLVKGKIVNFEIISGFLSSDNRMQTYKKMLSAMLSFETDRKRIVICDSSENIIMWISALQFALPLEIALNINFTTYEYDPTLSFSQICGVIAEGTKYSVNNADSHLTFDFVNNTFPNIEAEGSFFDFIDIGMSFSFDSILAYHRFILEKLTYRNSDENYLQIYSLYCLFTDDFKNIPFNTFQEAVQISNTYLLDNSKNELAVKFVEERNFILSADNNYAIEILRLLLNRISNVDSTTQESIKTLVAEKIIALFDSVSSKEETFSSLFLEIETICNTNNVDIPFELVKESNREKLLLAIRKNSELWRGKFILDILTEYVLSQNVPADQLQINHEIGQLIGNILKIFASSDTENGSALITRTVNKFADNWIYLLNMSLNIRSVLSDLPYSPCIKHNIWKNICQTIAKKHLSSKRNIYKFFLDKQMTNYVLDIYKEIMELADNANSAKEFFYEQLYINKDESYKPNIYEIYYKYLSTHKEKDTAKYHEGLLKMIISQNIVLNFSDELIASVLGTISFENLSSETFTLISAITEYKRHHVDGRLSLLLSGSCFSNIIYKTDLFVVRNEILNLTNGVGINLSGLRTDESKQYIEWVVPKIYRVCETANDMILSYRLFTHTKSSSENFINICAKETLIVGSDDKDFRRILVFLEFLFTVGNADERYNVGEIFSKLGKRKLKTLDEAVRIAFKECNSFLENWEDIRKISENENPLLSNILNVFKRNKSLKYNDVS